MSTNPTPHDEEQELAPLAAEVPVATFRENFSNSCKSLWFHVSDPLILRQRRGAPYRPANVIATDVWKAICDELPEQAPSAEQQAHIGARNGRNSLSKKILLPAWFRGQHTRVTAEDGAGYDVTFVPSTWWDELPEATKTKVMDRIRATRPKLR